MFMIPCGEMLNIVDIFGRVDFVFSVVRLETKKIARSKDFGASRDECLLFRIVSTEPLAWKSPYDGKARATARWTK